MAQASAEPAPPPRARYPLALRLVAALVLLLAALAATMELIVVPNTTAAFADHGAGLLRDGSVVMHELATSQTDDSSTVLVALIRHTTAARQRGIEDLPLELYADDLQSLRNAIVTADARRGEQQQANVRSLADEMARRAATTIDARLGELASRQREQTATFGAALRRNHLALVATALAVFVVVLGFGVHVLVVRPTRRLRAATHRVAAGDLSVELPPPSRDELGDLTRDFADMVRQLRESRAELGRLTAGLEDEVRRKTRHLEQALADLRASHQQLAQAERLASLGTLAGGIAHEFHNLIGGIRGCVAELAADETSADRRETLGVVTRATDRATSIVQQLLRFARHSVEQPADVDVAAVVEDALRLCEPAARRQSVRIERELTAGHVVRADAGGLHQVCVNLLTNALQAMPNGGVLHLRVFAPEPGAVALEVADTGTGIAANDLPHVFEPFFTTKAGEQDPTRRGSGLGLSVSWGIVRAHQGRIDVASTPGAGARFTVVLPARPAS